MNKLDWYCRKCEREIKPAIQREFDKHTRKTGHTTFYTRNEYDPDFIKTNVKKAKE